ncbi:MAG: choice-of-anchor Q domain-containing protein [Dokdonella sp.]
MGFDDAIGIITRNLWFGGNDSFAFDTNPLNANPQLVNPNSSDFHVARASSPVVDTGSATATSLVTNDFDADRPRPQGAGIDVGAYEFSRQP